MDNRNQYNRNRNYGETNNHSVPEKYVGAPYNFVPLNSTVIEYDSVVLPLHNEVSDDLLEGEIDYSVTAVSPVFVGSGIKDDMKTEKFHKDTYGRFSIPGSTIRGLVKSNAQILSLSSVADDIDDYSLLFRAVASGPRAEKERYGNILGAAIKTVMVNGSKQQFSVLNNVKAGYVKNEHGKYRIYRTKLEKLDENHGEMNYYILSERWIAEAYRDSRETGKNFRFTFFTDNGNILQHDIKEGFYIDTSKGKPQYLGTVNKNYKPYALPCSYDIKGTSVIAVKKSGELPYEGYAVSTGPMRGKKAVYIIPEGVFDEAGIEISEADLTAFRIDLKRRSTTLKTFGGVDKYDLPKEGNMRPVFYIQDGGRLYFGFTPRLRLFYDHTIKDGLPEEHKQKKLDYAKALFGYASKDESYKTRVSFGDLIVSDIVEDMAAVDAILGEPKPTSYLDYLMPKDDGTGKSYNDPDFQLRGIKQYWLRRNAKTNVPQDKKDKDFVTHFKPLPAGTQFKGKVRFKNLRKEELGLLLWSLKLEDDSVMNIGRAKAYGFGSISVKVNEVKLMDKARAYNMDSLLLDPYDSADPSEYIREYKNSMRRFLDGKDIMGNPSVSVLLKMKSPEYRPEEEKIRFMIMDRPQKEYQNRTRPLQKPDDLFPKDVQKKQEELKEGSIYPATVTAIQGKKIRFKVEIGTGVYGKMDFSDVECCEITKDNVKSILPEGKKIDVEYSGKTETGFIWKCNKID